MKKRQQRFPPGWNEARVKRLIQYYDAQPEEAKVAEDEEAFSAPSRTAMKIPVDLVPEVRELIAERERRRTARLHNTPMQRTGSARR